MRIVSLNTWKCEHHYKQRLALISEQVKILKPDIVLLQEVFRSDLGHDTAACIAEALSLNYYYTRARHKQRIVDKNFVVSESGLCLLSKFNIIEKGYFILPSDNNDGDRCAQWILISHHQRLIAVINTHLTHLSQRENLRKKQIAKILNSVEQLPMYDVLLLGGDMNAQLKDASLRFLLDQGWKSNWQPPYSCNNTLNIGEERCIDHLFLSPASNAIWSTSSTALKSPSSGGLFPSDHMAIYTTLDLD